MTPDFDPFLRSILAAPDDPLTWLIAADWCAEAGLVDEEACLRRKRIPIDQWTKQACDTLANRVPAPGRFIGDVCRNVAVFGTKPPDPDEFPDGSLEKFARLMMADPKTELSPKQLLWVWRLVLKYSNLVLDRELTARARQLLPAEIVANP